ncbi:MAG: hypothetical protein H7837_10710 [Magnetococcus sp. MYC-9]
MSLINKVLDDLSRRPSTQGGADLEQLQNLGVKPTQSSSSGQPAARIQDAPPDRRLLLGGVIVLLLGVGSWQGLLPLPSLPSGVGLPVEMLRPLYTWLPWLPQMGAPSPPGNAPVPKPPVAELQTPAPEVVTAAPVAAAHVPVAPAPASDAATASIAQPPPAETPSDLPSPSPLTPDKPPSAEMAPGEQERLPDRTSSHAPAQPALPPLPGMSNRLARRPVLPASATRSPPRPTQAIPDQSATAPPGRRTKQRATPVVRSETGTPAAEGGVAEASSGDLLPRARAALIQGDLHRTGAILQQIPPLQAQGVGYLTVLAAWQQQAGHFAQAVSSYQRLIELEPAQGRWWLGVAISQERLGRLREAYAAYLEAETRRDLDAPVRQFVQGRLESLAQTGNAP